MTYSGKWGCFKVGYKPKYKVIFKVALEESRQQKDKSRAGDTLQHYAYLAVLSVTNIYIGNIMKKIISTVIVIDCLL